MQERYLVVYPRGFIGVSNSGLNKETNNKSISDQITETRFNNPQKADNNQDVYSMNIYKMYRAMIDGVVTRDKFTFTRGVLVEAFRAFGSRDFSDWIKIQRRSRYFTLNHQKFILDTLRFIKTGKREVSMRNWEVILHLQLIDDKDSVIKNANFDKEIVEFFSSFSSNGKLIGTNLADVLPCWLSHRGGTEDLLLTLNMIFGKEIIK